MEWYWSYIVDKKFYFNVIEVPEIKFLIKLSDEKQKCGQRLNDKFDFRFFFLWPYM